ASLFIALVGPTFNYWPAYRAYGSVISFNGRKQMVESASDAYFAALPSSILSSILRKVLTGAGALSSNRNRIAHGVVGDYIAPNRQASGLALLPPEHAKNHRELPANLLERGIP